MWLNTYDAFTELLSKGVTFELNQANTNKQSCILPIPKFKWGISQRII